MIRVLLADDQALVRGAFAMLVGSAPDMRVVGQVGTGVEAVRFVAETGVDVVLMDIRMPEMDGIAATERIMTDPRLSGVRVLILTTFETDDNVVAALRAGASGFLAKHTRPEALLEGIRTVASGESLLSPGATRAVIGRVVRQPQQVDSATQLVSCLTEREREVLALVARGLTNSEIAASLVVSPLTAKTHVSRILTKLGARDRAQLVIAAYEAGLVRTGSHGRRIPSGSD